MELSRQIKDMSCFVIYNIYIYIHYIIYTLYIYICDVWYDLFTQDGHIVPREHQSCPAFLVQVLDQLPGRVFLCSRQGAAHLDDAPRKRQALKWLKIIGVGSGGKCLGKTMTWWQCLLKCGELHAKHSGSKMFELCCVKQTRIHISHHITCFTEPAYDLILLQVRRMLA